MVRAVHYAQADTLGHTLRRCHGAGLAYAEDILHDWTNESFLVKDSESYFEYQFTDLILVHIK